MECKEFNRLLHELCQLPTTQPLTSLEVVACVSTIKIGKNVYINSGMLAMAKGGITIEDGAMIAANVQLISNNHDHYDLPILTCKPVLIKKKLNWCRCYDSTRCMCRKTCYYRCSLRCHKVCS